MTAADATNFAADLFKKGYFTDFTVECGNFSFRVHKFRLYMQSGYFRTMLSSQMQEVAESKVVFEDLEPSLIARMLVFCYDESEYPEVLESESLPPSCSAVINSDKYRDLESHSFLQAELALQMYAIGERFDIENLKDLATNAFTLAFRAVDESGSVPRSMVNEEKCLSLIQDVYSSATIPQSPFRTIILTALKTQLKRSERSSERHLYLVNVINKVEGLHDHIISDYINELRGRSPSTKYRIKLAQFGIRAKDTPVWVDKDTTARSLIDGRAHCHRYETSSTGYIEYNGERLEDFFHIADLGLEDDEGLTLRYD